MFLNSLTVAAITFLVLPAGVALAQGQADATSRSGVEAFVKRQLACGSQYPKMLGAGNVRGVEGFLAAVEISGDACEGNMSVDYLVGVYVRGGRFVMIDSPISGPKQASFSNGTLTVTTLEIGPRDSRCCPTLRRTVRLGFSNGKLVEQR